VTYFYTSLCWNCSLGESTSSAARRNRSAPGEMLCLPKSRNEGTTLHGAGCRYRKVDPRQILRCWVNSSVACCFTDPPKSPAKSVDVCGKKL
jgi:hypothetical protein